MSKDQPSSKRKLKFSIEPVRVSDHDQASVRRVLGRLSGRVPFPAEGEDAAAQSRVEDATAGSPAPRSEPAPRNKPAPRNITAPGIQSAPGDKPTPGNITAPGRKSAPRRTPAPRRQSAPGTQTAGAARPTPDSDVSPRRDFTKTANSIVRDVLSRGLFRGKSRDIYDYLYSRTRGAIAPRRSALLTSSEIMRGANIGSDHTLRDNLRHLMLVGLVDRKVNSGAQEGNEYFVYLPEEVSLPFDREGNPLQLVSPPQVSSPGHPGQELPRAPGAETAGGAGGSSVGGSTTSGESKTSFKTIETKTDDEAFAGLLALLKQATSEVTGKDASPAEAERWREVGELLVAELKQAATRTTVSSAPAFLAEHLRRRLSRQPAPQHSPKPAAPATPAPAPEPPSDDELVEMFTGFLHQGMTVEDLDGQLSASIDPERWPRIRQAALERYELEREHVSPPTEA